MWKILIPLTFLILRSYALTATEVSNALRTLLSPESEVCLSNDTCWQTDTVQRWSEWNQPDLFLSVKPKMKGDVQKLVQYLASHKVPFLTTGGGHGYSSTIRAMGGVQIDMGNFNGVSVDSKNNLLTIGGSVRFRDIAEPVYAAGKAITVGACSCVGMTGATIGGGIGFYSGLYGAISDSLISMDMVTGTGELVTVSKAKNPDLLWGMKGAGFNFGTVTSLTYRVYDVVNDGYLMNADMMFSVDQSISVWKVVKNFFEDQPKELSLSIGILFDLQSKQVIITVNAIYAGTLSNGKKVIKPFLDLQPMNPVISYLPWHNVSDAALYGGIAANCKTNPYYIPYAANLYDIDVNRLAEVVIFINQTIPKQPALQATLVTFTQYAAWGFQQYAANSSAFPHRKQITFAQVDGIAASANDAQAVDSFGRAVRDLLRRQGTKKSLSVYTHFAHGDEGPTAWYTEEKLPNLRELKKRHDPKSLYSWYNPVS